MQQLKVLKFFSCETRPNNITENWLTKFGIGGTLLTVTPYHFGFTSLESETIGLEI